MNKSGIALITIVILVFTLSIMGLTFVSMINVDYREFTSQYKDLQAFYLAEGGIEKTLWFINNNIPPPEDETLEYITYGKKKIIGKYSIKLDGINPKNLSSIGEVNGTKIEVKIQAKVSDNPETEYVEYSFKPGTWERKEIK